MDTNPCGEGSPFARLASLEEKVGIIERQVEMLLHAQQQVALYLAEHGWGFGGDE